MRLRSRLHLAGLGLLLAGVSACTDESPVLTGDPFFPDGRPTTMEVIIPASQFLTHRGSFRGYSDASTVNYAVVANTFDGGVTSRMLLRFPGAFPDRVEFVQDGVTRRDSLYEVALVELLLPVDSAASVATPVQLSVYRLAEAWHDSVVSWEVRSRDSTGTHLWTQPGGTLGPLVGTGAYFPADSASATTLALSEDEVAAMRDSTYPGLLVESTTANSRMEFTDAELRITINPSNDVRDTTLVITRAVELDDFAFIYTPEPPDPAGFVQSGTVLSARTLFSMDLPDSVDVCVPACTRMAIKDLALNRVSLLLDPVPAGGGYRLLDSASVAMRAVTEPELGRLAPLGDPFTAGFGGRGAIPSIVNYAVTDTVVEIPFTIHAARLLSGDTIPSDFAILGATTGLAQPPFALQLFEPEPRLRIVFTLPERPRLP